MLDCFEKNIGDVKLVSVEPEKHMNVVVKSPFSGEYVGQSLPRDQAIELRDALIEAYPVAQTQPEPEPYIVVAHSTGFEIGRYTPSKRWKRVAASETEESAKKIAQALNEVEGL